LTLGGTQQSNQATDRAYRIGQDKPVFVYKMIIENSIEQKIQQIQEKMPNWQTPCYQKESVKVI
jgi:SNF2 family DNA or RNA helicase